MQLTKTTINALYYYGKTPRDVRWVGSSDGRFVSTWQEFLQLAQEVEDPKDYPSAAVPFDLVIVGVNWWLERSFISQGAQRWWILKELPRRQGRGTPLLALLGKRRGATATVAGLHRSLRGRGDRATY